MVPALQTWLRAPGLRPPLWQGSVICLLFALGVVAAPARAMQDQDQPDIVELSEPASAEKQVLPAVPRDQPISFEADTVDYNDKENTIIARGNVVLRRGEQAARADNVTWYRETGKILAKGNVRVVDRGGNQLFTEQVDLTQDFNAGSMDDLLLAMREGGRLAAVSGKQDADGVITLDKTSYSACDVIDKNDCPKKPSWRILADKVVYNPAMKQIRFRKARLEMFGARLLPLPGLMVRSDGAAISGLLVPEISVSPSNGLEFGQSYYVRLADNRDIAAGVIAYTKSRPMITGQYRALVSKGAYQITGYLTNSRRVPVTGEGEAKSEFRGYIFANGRLQLSPAWSVSGSVRRASDRTFLRRYDISRDDRLRSTVEAERIGPNSYLSIAGWESQTMRIGDKQGRVPMALPVIDYRLRLPSPVLGGKLEIQANSLAILRSGGMDTQRAFASARWDLRRVARMGQEITLTGLLRGDVYHSDENLTEATFIYRGRPGWQARPIATAALDVKWPFLGKFMRGTQVLTPHFQIVASPAVRNLAVPNEDARAIDLEDSNLFALNRFPGYDRIEDGMRFTYGFNWKYEEPRWRIKANIGQSFRLTREPTLLPNGTGLSSRTSDIVGRTEVRFRDFMKLTHRYRIDKDNLALRRNEVDLTMGNRNSYYEIGYLRLDRNISAGLEDLRDREEVRFSGRVAMARYWSLFGSGVVNLTDQKEDPLNKSDGFEPLRTRLGVAYRDDCLELAFTWRRDYFTTGDARKGNSFQIRFALRNLGLR